jgi:hypothetical protein
VDRGGGAQEPRGSFALPPARGHIEWLGPSERSRSDGLSLVEKDVEEFVALATASNVVLFGTRRGFASAVYTGADLETARRMLVVLHLHPTLRAANLIGAIPALRVSRPFAVRRSEEQ